MNRYSVNLSLPELASARYANLSLREVNNGGRTIGGDKGDLLFQGYSLESGTTVLDNPVLITSLELTADEAQEIADQVLQFSFESIGIETVEHS